MCGGLEHCTPDYAIHRASFPYFSIEYVARGTGALKLKGQAIALRPGTLFAYGPGVAQDITGNRTDPLVKYFVDFAGTDAGVLVRRCRLELGRATQVFPPHALSALFDELIESGLQAGADDARLCTHLLECLALKIAARRAPASGAGALAFASYQHCRRHVEQHFRRLRTLEEISKECRLDTAYLCRLFRRYDSQTPYQYLMRLKMRYAAQRLQQPGVLIKQVAAETGLSDPFHFSRVFRKILGLSPRAFRALR
jgi:AraC-like DNA-binding protein